METPQLPPARYQALLDSLVANFQPVNRLWPVSARLALWCGLQMSILVMVASLAPRPDLPMKLQSVPYVLELGAFVCASLLAAGLALRSAIPGEEATGRELVVLGLVTGVAIAVVFNEPLQADVPLHYFIQEGVRCVCCTYVLSVLPWMALYWTVRRGVPLAAGTSGGLIGAAALLFAFTVTRLGCPIDERLHILTWHVLPILGGTALSVLLGVILSPRTGEKPYCPERGRREG